MRPKAAVRARLAMKIFGYANTKLQPGPVVPEELAEVTLCASAAELRRIEEFLVSCANEMDLMGSAYDHVHLGDRMKEFEGSSPHFIVAGAEII